MQTTSRLQTWGGWVYDLAVDLPACRNSIPERVGRKEKPRNSWKSPGRVRHLDPLFPTDADKVNLHKYTDSRNPLPLVGGELAHD
jgi:hypothetical protein